MGAAARWDADAVRDDVRGYVIEHLGSLDAVPVVDNYYMEGTSRSTTRWRAGQNGPLDRPPAGRRRHPPYPRTRVLQTGTVARAVVSGRDRPMARHGVGGIDVDGHDRAVG